MPIKLSKHLIGLFKHCETICEAECCGIGAFNFSPFNIITYLIRYHSEIRESDVKDLRDALNEFEKNYGEYGNISHGCTVLELNAILTGKQVTQLSDFIKKSLEEASYLFGKFRIKEEKRYQKYLKIITK